MNQWKNLTPEQRRRKAEKLRELQATNRAARMRALQEARKQPIRPPGRHRLEPNGDGTYRCLTCLRDMKKPRPLRSLGSK